MKKKLLFISAFIISVLIILSSYIAGPPPGTTNAPGEKACADNPSCHTATPNTGPGFGRIIMMNGGISRPTHYKPGFHYIPMPFTVYTNYDVVGFQTVILFADSTIAGTIDSLMYPSETYPDYNWTQLDTLNGRIYVSHTEEGTSEPGIHDWMYYWTAPDECSGTVYIYGAFVAGTGDGNPTNDDVYYDTLIMLEDTTLSAYAYIITPDTQGNCNGTATVYVSGCSGPYTYLWNDPYGQTTDTATGLCDNSTFTVTVTNASGETVTASVLLTGIYSQPQHPPVFFIERIFPIPASDVVHIDIRTVKPTKLAIAIIDMNGKVVIQERQILINSPESLCKLNLSELNPGIYFLSVKPVDFSGRDNSTGSNIFILNQRIVKIE
ncbi:MAG: choice-of-anchor V domain-containing protein [Bacteroidota bacterium]